MLVGYWMMVVHLLLTSMREDKLLPLSSRMVERRYSKLTNNDIQRGNGKIQVGWYGATAVKFFDLCN